MFTVENESMYKKEDVIEITKAMKQLVRNAHALVAQWGTNIDNSKNNFNQFLKLCLWLHINPRLTLNIQNYWLNIIISSSCQKGD